jgi:NAD(P)-dependent dehydrogenase (short-subunit alcohol dehydrogenase family)
MDLGLKGKVVAVTGGSEGIGRATALGFGREGARLAVCARRADVLEAAARRIRDETGAEVLPVVADVTATGGCERFVEETVRHFGRIDVVVNNAGSPAQAGFASVTDEIYQYDLSIKLLAQVRTARAAIPHMRRQGGGAIVNLNMSGAKHPGAGQLPTVVSRAAGLAFTKALSKEFAADNIRVNAVAVGKIKSELQERMAARKGRAVPDYYAELGRPVPLGRMGEAHEVADAIVFLASAAAGYVTGTCVNVDGGLADVL